MERLDVLILGGSGFLGRVLLSAAHAHGPAAGTYCAHLPDAAQETGPWIQLDVTDAATTQRTIAAIEPRVVVNASVSTDPARARAVIVDGAANAASAARAAGAAYVQISSDMVFDGESGPFDESSAPSPILDYGRAKAMAERAAREAHEGTIVVRSPLLYRLDPPDPSTGTWLAGVRAGDGYALFTDEIRCPAPVEDVAHALAAIAAALARGESLPHVLHLPGPEAISRYAFGRLVLAAHGLDPDAARAAESGPNGGRPRDLTMLARSTPRAFTSRIRAPREALPEARTTAATPQPSPASKPSEDPAARRS